MDYLSVKEVAELKKCSVQHIQKSIKDGDILAEKRKHPQNKKMCYMIPVTALPENLQEKYYRQKRTETGILPEKKEPESTVKTALKYRSKGVKTAFESFSETERQTIQFWIDLLNQWQAERASRKDKTEFDKLFVAHQKYMHSELNISTDILYRKYAAYQNECYAELLDNRGGWNRGTSKLSDDSIIWQAFEDAGVESIRNDNHYYQAAGLEGIVKMSDRALQVLNAGYIKCQGDLKNLTLTTAVTAQQTYIQACNLAYMQVTSGTMDYNTAIRRAVQNAAKDGSFVLYPSGHRDRLDVAVRRSVLTGVGQSVRQLSLINAGDMGCDVMELTAHAGARPSHAQWQGQLVSLSGRRGYLSTSDIGYGSVDGFGGVNCRHDWHPFFENFSNRAYSEERLKELNEAHIKIGDKLYTDYEVSQMQRALERKIREKKRQVVAAKTFVSEAKSDAEAKAAQEDFQKASVKLKKAEQNLKDFLNQTGFLPDNARTWVNGFGRSEAQKVVWANKTPSYGAGSNHFKKLFRLPVRTSNPGLTNDLKDGKITVEEFFQMVPKLQNHGIDDCYNTTNPNYRTGRKEFGENCQRCVIAYELRRRGYDVVAKPAVSSLNNLDTLKYSNHYKGWPHVFSRSSLDFHSPDGNTIEAVRDSIHKELDDIKKKDNQNGRFIVRADFILMDKEGNPKLDKDGNAVSSGHVFIAEYVDGKTVFIDPQTGVKDASDYFNSQRKKERIDANSVQIIRIDNIDDKEFTKMLADCIESGEGYD